MKRTIACILSIAIMLCVAPALAGCGGQTDLPPGTIKITAFKGAYGEAFWEDLKKGFEEMYQEEGFKIEYETDQEPEDALNAQIRVKKGPDLIFLPIGQPKALTESLIKTKALADVSDILDEKLPGEDVTLRQKLIPGFVDNMATNPYNDKHVFMLPLFYSPLGMFYNKNQFNADGTDGKQKLPVTWAEFLALSSELPQGQKLFVYPNSSYMTEVLHTLIASHAGMDKFNDFLNYEDIYGDTKVQDVFRAVAQLDGKVIQSSWDVATSYRENQGKFLMGEAAFMPAGTWLPNEMDSYSTVDGFEYGFTSPFRISADDPKCAFTKLEQIYILEQSKNKDIAKKFLQYLYTDKATAVIADKAKGLVPTVNALAQAKEGNYIDEEVLGFYEIFADSAMKSVSGIFASANVPGVNWTEKYTGNYNNVMKKTMTPDAWMQEMKDAAAKLKRVVVR